MPGKSRWEERYKAGDTPWDTGRPDFHLMQSVLAYPIKPGKALEIGCGLGESSIWLARRGFSVTAIEISDLAVEKARANVAASGQKIEVLNADFLTAAIPGRPFGFLFDRGCFHTFRSEDERSHFAEAAAHHLAHNGLWLSVIGNADDLPRDTGPPVLTAAQIVLAVEPFFKIISLLATDLDSNRQPPPRAWACLMRKRGG